MIGDVPGNRVKAAPLGESLTKWHLVDTVLPALVDESPSEAFHCMMIYIYMYNKCWCRTGI